MAAPCCRNIGKALCAACSRALNSYLPTDSSIAHPRHRRRRADHHGAAPEAQIGLLAVAVSIEFGLFATATVIVRVTCELPASPNAGNVTMPLANVPLSLAETNVVFGGIVSAITTPLAAVPFNDCANSV